MSRALLSKYRKMSRPKKPCHGHFLGFLSRALILMSRLLFLVQKCHWLFFVVTVFFSKNITGTKTNVTGKKNTAYKYLCTLCPIIFTYFGEKHIYEISGIYMRLAGGIYIYEISDQNYTVK